VRRGHVFGRSQRKGGIAPFDRLVHQVMTKEPAPQRPRVFSIVQRKVLTPNDFGSLAEVARRLNDFERYYNEIAEPFGWLTRDDLGKLLRDR
jgi:hypothetical protein